MKTEWERTKVTQISVRNLSFTRQQNKQTTNLFRQFLNKSILYRDICIEITNTCAQSLLQINWSIGELSELFVGFRCLATNNMKRKYYFSKSLSHSAWNFKKMVNKKFNAQQHSTSLSRFTLDSLSYIIFY